MPIYTFENKKTGKQYNLTLSMAEREEYLKTHPDVQQILTQMNIGDPISLHVTKPPSDFQKYVLGKVKEKQPLGKALERRYTIPKEI